MMEHEFTLLFSIANCRERAEEIVELLGAAGLTDATLGIGRTGYISLDFTLAAASSEAAVRDAVAAIQEVLPRAILIEKIFPANTNYGANNF